MANTLDENLKAFLQADSSIAKLVGARISVNHVPEKPLIPFVWIGKASADDEICLDDAAGSGPFRHFFDVEIYGQSIRQARQIEAAIYSRLHKYRGSFGDSTIQGAFLSKQADSYIPRGTMGDTGLHAATLSAEVIP